jgi:hypothetical protein
MKVRQELLNYLNEKFDNQISTQAEGKKEYLFLGSEKTNVFFNEKLFNDIEGLHEYTKAEGGSHLIEQIKEVYYGALKSFIKDTEEK